MPELDPTSADDYRAVLGRVPTSVAIITALDDEEPVGVAVGSFTSVSLDPALVGFFIARTSTTWPRISPTGGFCANVLSATQEPVCRLFATRGADKFAEQGWHPSTGGRPILEGVTAWLDCEIESETPAGDHDLVLGRITSMGVEGERDPLVFLGGRYGQVVSAGDDGRGWGG